MRCCFLIKRYTQQFKDPDSSQNLEINVEHPELVDNNDTGDLRGKWGNAFDFLFTAIGYAVGLGNIWRFPFKVLNNGGGSFIIVYLLMLIIMALPLFLIELSIGQFTSKGVTECWHFCPGFKGIGYTMLILSLFCSIYYNTVIAWSFYYLYNSFYYLLPWTVCNNTWNDYMCVSPMFDGIMNKTNATYESSSTQFFMRQVIYRIKYIPDSDPIPRKITDNPEGLVLHITLCLAISWMLCAVILLYGVKVSGKAMYFFTSFPYFVIVIMIICGATLKGSGNGLKYYVTPNFSKLASINIWHKAAEQVFYSLGVGFGSMLTFGSYNEFSVDIPRNVILIGCINSGTSILAGIAVFELLGNMAYKYQLNMMEMNIYAGSGLIFVAYPDGLSNFTSSNFLLILFFIMILCLGIDSELGMLETVITGILDEFSFLRRHRIIFVTILNLLCFLVALIFATKTGFYWFTIMEYYSVATNLFVVGFFESFVIAYVYGIKNFSRDYKIMLGHDMNIFWKLSIAIIVPFCTLFLTLKSIIFASKTVIGRDYHRVVFPMWADCLGWIIFVLSIMPIPGLFLYSFVKQKLTGASFIESFKNIILPDMYYGPCRKRYWLLHPYYKQKWLKYRTNPTYKTWYPSEDSMDEKHVKNDIVELENIKTIDDDDADAGIDWIIFVLSILPIPGLFFYSIVKQKSTGARFIESLKNVILPDLYYGPSLL